MQFDNVNIDIFSCHNLSMSVKSLDIVTMLLLHHFPNFQFECNQKKLIKVVRRSVN